MGIIFSVMLRLVLLNDKSLAFPEGQAIGQVLLTIADPSKESGIKTLLLGVLISGIIKHGQKNVIKLNNENDLAKIIKDNAKSGDIVICVGAGSITSWAAALPNSLESIISPLQIA